MLRTLALAAGVLAWAAQPEGGQPLTVSAAVSLTEVMQAVGRAYERAGHGRVLFNFAASNVLARQIVNGAPVHVFISADETQMEIVRRAGLVSADAVIPLLGNRLAVVVRSDSTTVVTSPDALSAPAVRRIAIGNPDAVPAGAYARQYLERAGQWARVYPKLLPLGSVRAALAAVLSGAAEAGIVYVTDARSSPEIRVAAVIDGPHAPRIVYPAAAVSSKTRASDAAAFLKFLQDEGTLRIIAEHGFSPPPAEKRLRPERGARSPSESERGWGPASN